MLWNTKQSVDLQNSNNRISSCSLFIRNDSLHVKASHSSCRSQVHVAVCSHVCDIPHNHGQNMTFSSSWSFSWAQRFSVCYEIFTNNSLKVCSNRFATKSVTMEQFHTGNTMHSKWTYLSLEVCHFLLHRMANTGLCMATAHHLTVCQGEEETILHFKKKSVTVQ